MGVLSCSRPNCSNIMCRRYGVGYGYICDECYDELLNSRIELTHSNIKSFMESQSEYKEVDDLVKREDLLSQVFVHEDVRFNREGD